MPPAATAKSSTDGDTISSPAVQTASVMDMLNVSVLNRTWIGNCSSSAMSSASDQPGQRVPDGPVARPPAPASPGPGRPPR